MRALTVLYDERCALCRRARDFLSASPQLIELRLVALGSPEAIATYGRLETRDELWVVSDEGDAWVGPSAFVMCLWALRDHRALAELLASPLLAPLARRFFRAISSQRARLSTFFDDTRCGEHGCTLPHHGPYR